MTPFCFFHRNASDVACILISLRLFQRQHKNRRRLFYFHLATVILPGSESISVYPIVSLFYIYFIIYTGSQTTVLSNLFSNSSYDQKYKTPKLKYRSLSLVSLKYDINQDPSKDRIYVNTSSKKSSFLVKY